MCMDDFKQCEFCTDIGCRHLVKNYRNCNGAHIGQDLCVLMDDFSCVSCEEITDPCICVEQGLYCHYDYALKKCQSKSCQSYNSNCPETFCKLVQNGTGQICLPQCFYNYNKIQCSNDEQCQWSDEQKVCEEKPIKTENVRKNPYKPGN